MVVSGEGNCHNYTVANSPLQTNALMALAADNCGQVYIGTYNFGVYRYVHARRAIERVPALQALEHARVMSLAFDTLAARLVIGTNGEGVWAYDVATGECRRIGSEDNYNQWIICIGDDPQEGVYWVATQGGVFRFAGDSLFERQNLPNGGSPRVYDMEWQGDSVLWLASEEGLLRYVWQPVGDGRAGGSYITTSLQAVVNPEASFGEEIASLCADSTGTLWYASNTGLGAYDLQSGQFVSYHNDEIAMVGGFAPSAAQCSTEGVVTFGGDNGVVYFRPAVVTRSHRPLKEIIFTRLWVNNVPTDYDPNRDDNVLDAALWHAKTLTLPADANSFSINFASQEYYNPYSIRYAYRLDGYDETWHEVHGSDVGANYSHLPWGTYTLQVRAYTSHNMSSATFKQLNIIVRKPWYVRWWAFLLYALVVGGVAYAVVQYYRVRIRQRRMLEKARRAEQVKESKLRIFTSISHDLKTPLTLILSPLRRLMKRKDVDRPTQKLYELMYRNALRILMLVNQQMDVRKIDNGQLHLHMRPLVVKDFLSDIMQYFEHAAQSHLIHYKLYIPRRENGLQLWGDPEQLDKVIFNLLSNAFKYVPDGGTVRVEVTSEDNLQPDGTRQVDSPLVEQVVRIVVFNSGSSIDAEDVEHIFERFFQGHGKHEKVGTGIGLNLAHELAELHHGTLAVENATLEPRHAKEDTPPLAGVRFILTLPAGDAHLTEEERYHEPADEEQAQSGGAMMQEISDSVQDISRVSMAPEKAEQPAEPPQGEPDAAQPAPKASPDRPTSVLLVDDEPEILEYLRTELSDYTVVTARSGDEAWATLLAAAPDVVVTDVRMEGGDGLDLCMRIKSNPDTLRIPVIVLTGEVGEEMHASVLSCQADHYLTKPVNVALLRSAIYQSVKTRTDLKNQVRQAEMGFDYDQKQMPSPDDQLLARVRNAIQKHLDDSDYGVDQLAADCGLSRVHLNRKLKELIGTSPSQLMKTIRLRQAALLLVGSKVTIAEIAYTVGFTSPSYFTQNFTQHFGMTPKEFVARYPNDENLRKLLEQRP